MDTSFLSRFIGAPPSMPGLPAVEPAPDVTTGMAPDGRTSAAVASEEELSEFKRAAMATEASMKLENEGDYYACVTFPTDAHRDAFFTAIGVAVDGDGMCDGLALARALKIELPPVPPAKGHRSGKGWAAMPSIERLIRP